MLPAENAIISVPVQKRMKQKQNKRQSGRENKAIAETFFINVDVGFKRISF